jgi:hypothetical protein
MSGGFFVPTWALWLIYAAVVIGLSLRFGRSESDYDFFSPMLGFGILLIGVAGAVGFLLSRWFA